MLTNWPKVIYDKHKGISIFKIPKAKSGIPENIRCKEEHINI